MPAPNAGAVNFSRGIIYNVRDMRRTTVCFQEEISGEVFEHDITEFIVRLREKISDEILNPELDIDSMNDMDRSLFYLSMLGGNPSDTPQLVFLLGIFIGRIMSQSPDLTVNCCHESITRNDIITELDRAERDNRTYVEEHFKKLKDMVNDLGLPETDEETQEEDDEQTD